MQITNLAAELGVLLLERDAQVSTAESCTGGGIAEAITRVAGSSAWFEASVVTYSNQQKTKLLQVSPELLRQHGAVSIPVVEAMVRGAQLLTQARYAVSVSGIAGPGGGSELKPVGTVCFAWAANEKVESITSFFSGDRSQIRQSCVRFALEGLILMVQEENIFRLRTQLNYG